MSEIKDGGPAFPLTFATGYIGMSKRELFAGMALMGLCVKAEGYPTKDGRRINAETFAERSYEYADAMILAGEGGK